MPHDAKNDLLEDGDIVLIPCRIVKVQTGEDYCNAEVETLRGRRPDGAKERMCAINTGTFILARPGTHIHDVLAPFGVLD